MMLQRDEQIRILQTQVQGLLLKQKQNEHETKINSQEEELILLTSRSPVITATTKTRTPRYYRSYK